MGADAMNDPEKSGMSRIRIADTINSKLFLAAAIVMTATAALSFGRIGEGVVQICIFAFTAAVAAELFALRSCAAKGRYRQIRNDTVGILAVEAVLCFLTAGVLLYAASLVYATFFPVANFLRSSQGMSSLVSRVTNAVSIATAGAVPATFAPKVTALIRSLTENFGAEKAGTILNIAVWATVGSLFVGMLVRIASGILLLCSASGIRKALDMTEGREDLTKPSKYLIVAGIGIAVCSGVPAGGVVLILAGRALSLSSAERSHRFLADEIKNDDR